jgi:Ran GTPase-activating protein (RanGAP) involved in mRNA processing and transport
LVLSLKGNKLATKEAGKALAAALAGNSVLKEIDLSSNFDGDSSNSIEFAQELAVGIRDNGALTSLNLSSNNLRAEGGKIVAEAIKVTNCAIAVVLAPFSCPSNHWMVCCCLLLSTG